MENLYYEEPSLEREADAIDFINEFVKYNSEINGSGGLDRYFDNYQGWLQKLEDDKNVKPGSDRVPARTYFLVRESDNRIVGMVNIRLALNERLRKSGGHIGYCIRPTERRKGYNKVNLYLALQVCQKYGIENAMLSCDKINEGSSKTMKALGATFEREFEEDNGEIEEVYNINVKDSIEKYKDLYASHKSK